LELPENGSAFVVFRAAGQGLVERQATERPAVLPREIPLGGPWKVRFEPGRGAPEESVFEELFAWDQHADSGIKYFSGKATYHKSFELKDWPAGARLRLQLGNVKCVAQVRLNGKDLGVAWTDPWSVELTSAVKQGVNALEIDVINTWVNRLIGDAGLPPDKRITKTNVALERGKRTLKVYQSFGSEDPLMRSGLLGPVRIEFAP
jgi:hypothetical protein